MSDLGLSGLSDDQLLQLLRELLAEITCRDPAVKAAAQAAALDADERVKITRESAEREAAILRAKERERIAKVAAEQVRAANAESQSATDKQAVAQAAAAAAESVRRKQTDDMSWLKQASELLGLLPQDICLVEVPGARVVINKGCDRYSREHIVDWNRKTGEIKARAKYVGIKPELAALCAAWKQSVSSDKEYHYIAGDNFDWSKEAGHV